jgi:light-regulated signal transduction histidine kinase (bacteriophytochrome)
MAIWYVCLKSVQYLIEAPVLDCIYQNISESHGGMIKGENNKDGKGATFTFVLPLEQGEQHKDQ